MNTRFARFRNVPELVTMFGQVADVQTAETLALPTPQTAGGAPETVVVPASDGLRAYVGTLAERAERVRNRAVDASVDNMLKVTGDGRKAALDLRLVGEDPDPQGGKIAALAERVAGLHHANADRIYIDPDGAPAARPGALQLVFCDLGTPKPGPWSVYDAVRDRLIARGVPAGRIRFVHEAANDAAKAALFADCRDGRVAVLLGSTEKMGIGTNVQRRLLALHHLDAPWRPADIEQREGRILRQGNQNPVVHVFRYVTEGSFDVYMWQTLERKAAFIGQILTGRAEAREVEEISDSALSYAEVKALATGNPLILEKAEVDTEIARLARLRSAHERERARLVVTEREQGTRAAVLAARADALDQTAAGRVDTRGGRFAVELDGRVLRDRSDAGELLREQLVAGLARADEHDRDDNAALGRLGGYPLRLEVREPRSRNLVLHDDASVVIQAPGPLRVGYRRDDLSRDPRQLVQRLERALHGVEAAAESARERAAVALQEAARARQRHEAPFPDQDRLARLRDRQRQIEQQLAPEPEQPVAATFDSVPLPARESPVPAIRTWSTPDHPTGPAL